MSDRKREAAELDRSGDLDVLYGDPAELIVWVGGSADRARRILSLELDRPRPRRLIVDYLWKVADAAGP